MTGLLVCLSAAAMGVEYGWQPVAGGGIEYIIQIEPALLDSLKSGRDVFSDLPSSVSNVRRYRITVGSARLPHHGEPPPPTSVMQAGGQVQSGRATRETPRSPKLSEIDDSQLPGPVLSPALVLDKPANKTHDKEPEHLAEANGAEPMDQRVTGFHPQRDATADETASVETGDKSHSDSLKPDAQKEIATQQEPPLADVKPHPDKSTLKPDVVQASKTTLFTQLGLLFSVGGNVFLLWVATDQRRRYRAIVRRMFDGAGASFPSNREVEFPRREGLPAPDKLATNGSAAEDASRVDE